MPGEAPLGSAGTLPEAIGRWAGRRRAKGVSRPRFRPPLSAGTPPGAGAELHDVPVVSAGPAAG